MATAIETYRGTIYPWELDQLGHMNVRHYMAKFDEANWQLFTRLGMDIAYFKEQQRGMAAVQQTITYCKELFAGDCVVVRTTLEESGARKLRFIHHMHDIRTDEEVSALEAISVHIDRAAHKAVPFPDFVQERVSAVFG